MKDGVPTTDHIGMPVLPMRLAAGEVHVWLLQIGTTSGDAASEVADTTVLSDGDPVDRALLSTGERAAAEALPAGPLRYRAVAAHAALRRLLSRYGAMAPQDWRMVRGKWGRPEIEQGPAPRFSLSYGTGLVAIAFAHGVDIGVDVISTARDLDVVTIAGRAFAPEEIADLQAREATAARDRFFDIWPLKEAYAKARGVGFWSSPQRYAFTLSGEHIGFRSEQSGAHSAEEPDAWSFALYDVPLGHRLALAVGASNCDRAVFRSVRDEARVPAIRRATSFSPR